MAEIAPDLRRRPVADVSDPPFAVPADIIVDLPMPPSVNSMWRHSAQGKSRVHLSPAYKKWKQRADMVVLGNRQGPRGRLIRGPFEAIIGLSVDAGLVGDIDNRVKATLDWAQSREYILDDKYCIRLTIGFVRAELAPHGCRLTLRPSA